MTAPEVPADLVLGLDGGQTGTVCVLGTAAGQVVGTGIGGPLRHGLESDAVACADAAVAQAVQSALLCARSDADQVIRAYLSVTGSGGAVLAAVQRHLPRAQVVVALDVLTTLVCAGITGPGVGVASGTGSVAFARSATDETIIVGGWGYILGDDGSGYSIGLNALRIACRIDDEMVPDTGIGLRLLTALHQTTMREVYDAVLGGRIDRVEIAALAKVVAELAEAGDVYAVSIVRAAASALADMVQVAATRANLIDGAFQVVAVGGVVSTPGAVMSALTAEVAERMPNARIVAARFAPAVGALALALQAGRVPLTDHVLTTLEHSSRQWGSLSSKPRKL